MTPSRELLLCAGEKQDEGEPQNNLDLEVCCCCRLEEGGDNDDTKEERVLAASRKQPRDYC